MDGLVEQLLRLENAKHRALVEIEASAYQNSVRRQQRLIAKWKGTPSERNTDIKSLLALSQLITLNTRLLQNLESTTPWFVSSGDVYSSKRVADARTSRGLSAEA